jgi:DNA-binding Lrp family transcriptional regulator
MKARGRRKSAPEAVGESDGVCGALPEILLLAALTPVYKAPLSKRRMQFVEQHKLDSIDLRILAELQANGRITNVELSRRAKITAPPCLRRMRALEKAGYIQGYHADLDARALGFEVTGFVFVGLASQNDADLKRFEEKVRSWPEVRECHMLSGEVDFLLKCVASDLSAFQTFITERLTAEKNVASVKSSLVIHATKHEPGVPIEVRG